MEVYDIFFKDSTNHQQKIFACIKTTLAPLWHMLDIHLSHNISQYPFMTIAQNIGKITEILYHISHFYHHTIQNHYIILTVAFS